MILSNRTAACRVILALFVFPTNLRAVDLPAITLNDGLARPTVPTVTPAGYSSLSDLRWHSTLPEEAHP
jgi:hypothetical protein